MANAARAALRTASVRRQPSRRAQRTSSDITAPTSTDCSIHDGAATSPVLAKQLLSDKTSHAGAAMPGAIPMWPESPADRREQGSQQQRAPVSYTHLTL